MNALVLKLIACAAMLCDHTGYMLLTFLGNIARTAEFASLLRIIGRISMPIYSYLIVCGYRKTSSTGRYLLRLIVFGLLSETVYDSCFFGRPFEFSSQNVMFTLALGLCAVSVFDRLKQSPIGLTAGLIFVAAAAVLAEFACLDYGMWGIILIFVYFLSVDTPEKKETKNIFLIFCSTLLFAFRYFLSALADTLLSGMSGIGPVQTMTSWELTQIYSIFAVIPILLYNGKRGVNINARWLRKLYQYGFYAYYPVHLLVLWLIFR